MTGSRERELLELLAMVRDVEIAKVSAAAAERELHCKELAHWSNKRATCGANENPRPETSAQGLASEALYLRWIDQKRSEIRRDILLAEARVETQKKQAAVALGRFDAFEKTVAGCNLQGNRR